MPLYEIHHSLPLTHHQQSHLASAITTLHCTTFSAPSIFVNITFHPLPRTPSTPSVYVGGHPQHPNYIIGHLRPRPHNTEKLHHIVMSLTRIWNAHARPVDGVSGTIGKAMAGVGLGYKPKDGDGRLDDERALHNVFLMEDIVAGSEQGFLLPVAGRDGEWARENMGEFERRARDGDESMKRLVGEMKGKL